MSCYKSHQVILHHKPTVSTDSDLRHVLHTTVTQCPSLRDAVTYQDVLNVAITNAVVTVGNALLENRALLLPSIHSVFIQELTTLSMQRVSGNPKSMLL